MEKEIPLTFMVKKCVQCGEATADATMMTVPLCQKHAVEALIKARSSMPHEMQERIDLGLEILSRAGEEKKIDFMAVAETLMAVMFVCRAMEIDFGACESMAVREFVHAWRHWKTGRSRKKI
jgi:hypothetical protein